MMMFSSLCTVSPAPVISTERSRPSTVMLLGRLMVELSAISPSTANRIHNGPFAESTHFLRLPEPELAVVVTVRGLWLQSKQWGCSLEVKDVLLTNPVSHCPWEAADDEPASP